MVPTLPSLSLRWLMVFLVAGLVTVLVGAQPHPDTWGWNALFALLGVVASTCFTLAGLTGLLDVWRRHRWNRSLAHVSVGTIDVARHHLASVAMVALEMSPAGTESADGVWRFRLRTALTLPFTPTRAEELRTVAKELKNRSLQLFQDREGASAVADRVLAQAADLEGRADRLWSSVLQIHQQIGSPALGLLHSGHELTQLVRELADSLGYGSSVAAPVGLMKSIEGSRVLDAAEKALIDLDVVYRAVESGRLPAQVADELRRRREGVEKDDVELREFQAAETGIAG